MAVESYIKKLTDGWPESLTLTENLSFTHSTTKSECLNLFFDVLQRTRKSVIESHLHAAWHEDPLLTLKIIFHLRDIRKGKGARKEFYHCMLWLYNNHFPTFKKNLHNVARHGYWKDLGLLIMFVSTGNVSFKTNFSHKQKSKKEQMATVGKVKKLLLQDSQFADFYYEVVNIFVESLKIDQALLNSTRSLPSTALCGKWSPTIGCSVDSHTALGKNIASALFPSYDHRREGETDRAFLSRIFIAYRKEYLIPLRKAIAVPESLMSRNKWNEIDYDRVPSLCMNRNKGHFQKHDQDRFTVFLQDVQSGKKKIASGALLPHKIVAKTMSNELDQQVAELQWASYVANLEKHGNLSSALAVADVSPSMKGEPMEVAIGML
jgi:hypothetical protein